MKRFVLGRARAGLYNGGEGAMAHVTLNGRTFFYTTNAVYMNGKQIFGGVVTFGLLQNLAEIMGN